MAIEWKPDVEKHDYAAALDYLTLLLNAKSAKQVVRKLKDAPVIQRRANDILRACHREPLTMSDPGVAKDHVKVAHQTELSPVLVVSFSFGGDIADGYHRVSLAYNLDPFSSVPLKLVALD